MDKHLADLIDNLDIVAYIRDHVRLVEVNSRSTSLKGNCPFCGDTRQSFYVSPKPPAYHCFNCGKGGNLLGFVIRHLGLEFNQQGIETAIAELQKWMDSKRTIA